MVRETSRPRCCAEHSGRYQPEQNPPIHSAMPLPSARTGHVRESRDSNLPWGASNPRTRGPQKETGAFCGIRMIPSPFALRGDKPGLFSLRLAVLCTGDGQAQSIRGAVPRHCAGSFPALLVHPGAVASCRLLPRRAKTRPVTVRPRTAISACARVKTRAHAWHRVGIAQGRSWLVSSRRLGKTRRDGRVRGNRTPNSLKHGRS